MISQSDLLAERSRCERCGGSGWHTHQPDKKKPPVSSMCVCTRRLMFLSLVGPQIFSAERIQNGPVDGKHTQRLFLRGSPYSDWLPAIRSAFVKAHLTDPNFSVRIVTDEQIRASGLPPHEGQSPSSTVEGAALVVVRLGFIGVRNSAAPGYLLEALLHRVETLQQPIWVVHDPQVQWGRDHFAWSERVGSYLKDYFTETTR